MKKVAVLVDGGFYKKRAETIYGALSPEDLADKLLSQCFAHIKKHAGKEIDQTAKDKIGLFFMEVVEWKNL